ncbi:MAG TPA: class I SAM-dependent methyltransferase, partial [Hyphomicrobiaceae bacterium]|nr:class I SAM-dependent methyltransferase [Hyphomicrobiaceae bacterium]
TAVMLRTDEVQFVKELYPRLREDDAAIERYRAALDRLPPIVVARGRVLVDGYHRWQAHIREEQPALLAEDLGNLTDVEIFKESLRRNASHGVQLVGKDKRNNADRLYRLLGGDPDERYQEISDLLSVTVNTAKTYCRDARRDERAQQQAAAWDLWLDCWSERAIAECVGVPQSTIGDWLTEIGKNPDFGQPPASRQHFDVWQFRQVDDDDGTASYFGRMPGQVVENLLWLYTEPGNVVVDPFVGGGTTIDVAKRMGRRIWASDLTVRAGELRPVHQHDMATGWPADAPRKADLILLDPPYWQQAAGRYSNEPADFGNMPLAVFMDAWHDVLAACGPHLADGGHLAFIISPSVDGDAVIDHAFEMARAAAEHGLMVQRRIIVPYTTEQATGQQVEWARDKRQLLKLYRDLVILAAV